jgi:NAD(P)-dependent dehydrogenase (short-subunit alcohol dehydrogenase family)
MPRQPRSLKDTAVAVTGGARGIGRATATALARAGARVAIGDLDGELAASVAAEIGAGARGFALDVADRASFERFLDDTEDAFGPLDVLVNNAGIFHLGAFVDEDAEATARQIDVNLHGVINGTRLALRRMRPRGRGHIVNVASSAGKISPPGGATYAATKHGVVGLTEAVRAEHRGEGIDFSIVMPGVVRTDMVAGYEMGRGVKDVGPEEVADAIVDALRRPRVNVFVPRNLDVITRFLALLPVRAQDAMLRAFKADRILWEADRSARAAYEARAAASDPARDELPTP